MIDSEKAMFNHRIAVSCGHTEYVRKKQNSHPSFATTKSIRQSAQTYLHFPSLPAHLLSLLYRTHPQTKSKEAFNQLHDIVVEPQQTPFIPTPPEKIVQDHAVPACFKCHFQAEPCGGVPETGGVCGREARVDVRMGFGGGGGGRSGGKGSRGTGCGGAEGVGRDSFEGSCCCCRSSGGCFGGVGEDGFDFGGEIGEGIEG